MSVEQTSNLEDQSTRLCQERVDRNAEDLLHPNVAAFLQAIAAAEGGGYDFKYGAVKGRRNDRWRFTDMSTHPGPGIDGKSTAAGMYQITRPTWEHHGGKLGLCDFSPRTQDLIAVEILHSLGVIAAIKEGEIAAAMPKAARTWAALPKGPGQKNHYPSQRYMKFTSFLAAYLGAGGQVKKQQLTAARHGKPAATVSAVTKAGRGRSSVRSAG
ncbi:paar repeat-containing protein [Massilia sp. H6]|uniref:paar repeat-containing protein n=1 Tax=Massilia sp. H6 TaxID=2970464 RepID=UPI002167A597|nr:paar repeat-containing protein [Massilia sp. H6]UVW28943.1 paar repeat-containing protein [Massilia sp. H6]